MLLQLLEAFSVNVTHKGPHPLVISDVKPGVGKAFTVIVCVAVSPHAPLIEYVIVLVPMLATEGSNVPADAFVIPVPDHVPPTETPVKLKTAAFAHTGGTAVIVAFREDTTLILTVSVAPQVPEME
jgi:hypothetical protein